MAIRETLFAGQFVSRFKAIRPDNFSNSALYALFYYFDNLSDGIGEDIEFDPIAICCEYSECTSVAEFCVNWDLDPSAAPSGLNELWDTMNTLDAFSHCNAIPVKDHRGDVISILFHECDDYSEIWEAS